ncbi:rhomboid family intramembrane serine protease [Flavobacterium sp.]|jgi:membrane associated rhomboid family serine protease|uniref:rhomboid family intramembrane serine protease n=1 Tax=Flavobacterium sp. TaxID=239 RepID=UPI0037BFBA1E
MNILDDVKLQYRTGGMVQKLLFWNIGLFVLATLVDVGLKFSGIAFSYFDYVALSSNTAVFIAKPWTILTFNFFHAGVFHLIFNVLLLHFSGRLFNTYFTDKQLFGVYLLGGIFSGLTFIALYFVLGKVSLLVGASGAIMALLIATATYAPFMLLRIPLVGTVKLWHVAFFILLMDLIQLPLENMGGHLAHFGGALFGFMYIKLLQKGVDLTKPISVFLDRLVTIAKPKPKTPFRKVHRNTEKKSVHSYGQNKDMTQKQIDEILDKISQSGYDCLTKEEKEFLFKAGK